MKLLLIPTWPRIRLMRLCLWAAPLAYPKSRQCLQNSLMESNSISSYTLMKLWLTEQLSRQVSCQDSKHRASRMFSCSTWPLYPLELQRIRTAKISLLWARLYLETPQFQSIRRNSIRLIMIIKLRSMSRSTKENNTLLMTIIGLETLEFMA